MLVRVVYREIDIDAARVRVLGEVDVGDGSHLDSRQSHRRAVLQAVGIRHAQPVSDLRDPDALLAADGEDPDREDEDGHQHDAADSEITQHSLSHASISVVAPPRRNSRSLLSVVRRASSIVPTKLRRPSYRKAIRSPTVKALLMSCVRTTEVTSSAACRFRISLLIAPAVIGSSPVVGSS